MRIDRFTMTAGILFILGSVLTAAFAQATPRYSARYEQSCNLCHFNPSGGGQRSDYATQFIVPTEMAMTRLSDEEIAAITPNVSEAITIGADLRTFFFNSDLEGSSGFTRPFRAPSENFFQMQGTVYASFQMTRKVSAHFFKGINTSYELFGLGYLLPADGYVKVGRFMPNFGWRFSDHNFFVRDYMGFFPPTHTDVGLEAGISPGRFVLSASVTNGQLGSTRDFNDKVAVTARALYRWNVSSFGAGLGGSYWQNETGVGKRTAGGVFGYFKVAPVTWLWEVDLSQQDSTDAGEREVWFTSNELNWQIVQGLDLKGTFDFIDPNTEKDTGKRYRYGLGGEIMPYPFVRLELVYNWYRNSSGQAGMDITEPEYNQLIVQAHLFY